MSSKTEMGTINRFLLESNNRQPESKNTYKISRKKCLGEDRAS